MHSKSLKVLYIQDQTLDNQHLIIVVYRQEQVEDQTEHNKPLLEV